MKARGKKGERQGGPSYCCDSSCSPAHTPLGNSVLPATARFHPQSMRCGRSAGVRSLSLLVGKTPDNATAS